MIDLTQMLGIERTDYPYWSPMEGEDGRALAFYWISGGNIGAIIVHQAPGHYRITYSGDSVAEAMVDSMGDAQQVAEAILRIINLNKEKHA